MFPKPIKQKKVSKVRVWEKKRAELKQRFFNAGIVSCEMCGSTFGLSFAHSKKRRDIVGDEIDDCALLCVDPCHNWVEKLSHAEMFRVIQQIIKNRRVKV